MKKLILLSILVICLMSTLKVFSTTYFVRATGGDDTYTGLSAAFAFATIDHALSIANNNDEIRCLNNYGIFYENVTWPNTAGIILTGYDDLNGVVDYATIDGSGNGSVMSIINYNPNVITNSTSIQYLCIQSGFAQNGGGIYMEGYVFPTLWELKILDNHAVCNGGGIYFLPSDDFNEGPCYSWSNSQSCNLTNILIEHNTAGIIGNPPDGMGGGVYVAGSGQGVCNSCTEINISTPSMYFYQCLISPNTATGNGGGIAAISTFIILEKSTVAENQAVSYGGGVFCKMAKTIINNSGIEANRASYGGGVYIKEGLRSDPASLDCIPFDGIEHSWLNSNYSFNDASQDGGALFTTNSNQDPLKFASILAQVGNSKSNNAIMNGGAFYIDRGTDVHLKDIWFSRNQAVEGSGGAIYNNCELNPTTMTGWTPENDFDQLLITKNACGLYGSAIFTKQTFFCINSTISDNYTATLNDGAIACFSWTINGINQFVRPSFLNTIIYYNYEPILNPSTVYLNDQYCDPQFNYCQIEGYNLNFGFTGPGSVSWVPGLWSNGILANSAAPVIFVDQWNDNYNLAVACSGLNLPIFPILVPSFATNYFGFVWPNDIIGAPRVQGIIDKGAYEFVTKKSIIEPIFANSSLNFDVSLTNNPVKNNGECNLIIHCDSKTYITYYISDISGKLLYSESIVVEDESVIPLGGFIQSFNKGLYIISLEFNDSQRIKTKTSRKLVVL